MHWVIGDVQNYLCHPTHRFFEGKLESLIFPIKYFNIK